MGQRGGPSGIEKKKGERGRRTMMVRSVMNTTTLRPPDNKIQFGYAEGEMAKGTHGVTSRLSLERNGLSDAR